MVERTRRCHVGRSSLKTNGTCKEKTFHQAPPAPATSEDRRLWKGFCEIESEPVRSSLEWEDILPCGNTIPCRPFLMSCSEDSASRG